MRIRWVCVSVTLLGPRDISYNTISLECKETRCIGSQLVRNKDVPSECRALYSIGLVLRDERSRYNRGSGSLET